MIEWLRGLALAIPENCRCGKSYFYLGRPNLGASSVCPWCLGFKK